MYSFRFFRSVHAQRRELLAASEYADVAIDPLLRRTLTSLGEEGNQGKQSFDRRDVWLGSIRAIGPLLIRSAGWQCVSAVGMVMALFAARYILSTELTTTVIVALCLTYLLAECGRHTVFFFDLQRRAQIARGIQLFLFDKVNKKLLRLDVHSNPEFSTGNVKTLLSGDVEAVEDFITTALGSWVPALVILSVTTGPIVALAGGMGMVGISIALLQVPIALSLALLLERYKDLRQTEQDRLATTVGEWVRNVRLVRYLNWEPVIAQRIRDALRRFSIAAGKAHFLVCLAYGVSYSWWAMPILGMLVYSSYADTPLSAAEFFPTVWFLSLLSNQIQFLPHSLTQLGEASAAVARLVRFFSLPEVNRHFRPETGRYTADALGIPVRIHVMNVTVAYQSSYALSELSLTIDLAAHVAVVGEVGSGKTTLLKLLVGELAPLSGEIEVEFSSGVRAPLWNPEVYSTYRNSVAYAPQEPFLSNASLRDNIDLSTRRDEAEVEGAAERACLAPDIELFPHKLHEEVGETGINLSGGQKQRVSLARAFVSARPFLFLDDPLSAVDSGSERSLFANFLRDARGFVLVSHRLDELDVCDRIIVLEGGRIMEDGRPHELLERSSSRYRTFLKARRRGEGHGS